MINKIFKIIIAIILIILLFIGYVAYFGIETTKFNPIIKDQIKKQNNSLDINLKKVKLHLNLKKASIKIKTKNPTLILNNAIYVDLEEITSNISISSYLQKKFSIKNISLISKNNEIKKYIDFYRIFSNKSQLLFINQIIKDGNVKLNILLNFDQSGKIKKDYKIIGIISDAELGLFKYKNIKKLNFNFEITNKNYNLKELVFKFNNVKFNSDFLNIKSKGKLFSIDGNIRNKKSKINKDIILLLYNNNYENFDFSNTQFNSTSEFSFNIDKKLKIKKLKINSELNLDQLILKYKLDRVKNYINDYNNLIYFKQNKFKIEYKDKNIMLDGSSEFYLDNKIKNFIDFKIKKNNKKTFFESTLDLTNINIKVDDLSYYKPENLDSILKIKGSINDNKVLFNNINYTENKNKILINNLKLEDNKILKVDNFKLNYITKNNFKNQLSLSRKNKDYKLIGKSYDSIFLIDSISNSSSNNNFFNNFKNLNSKIIIKIDEVKLDKKNKINNLRGNLLINKNKITDLNITSNYSNNEKLVLSIKKNIDKSIVTNFYSDRAEPFVKKYKFIKGFENGNIIFNSSKINDTSKSRIVIDNFKVKEIPVLAKILTLASLQGIADLLTGEGIRFTDFEMTYVNKGSLMTIEEIYAIGPAISIMMEGYVEGKDLVSLRGTLVPATTINRTISSIPLLGDLLVGKKVGEGVFGVSFKIKGPPKDLKTKVNPIKTLTPRFITRTLEKIKKN